MFGVWVEPRIAFPEVKTFQELFSRAKRWHHEPGEGPPDIKQGEHAIQRYCRQSDRPSLEVTPRKAVRAIIAELMVAIEYDCIGFEVIHRQDGTALVTANYNKIGGNLHLAVIDGKTVPAYRKTDG